MHRLIIATLFLCVLNLDALSATTPPEVWVYYYPWYNRGSWDRHPYPNTPVLGEYKTDDVKVVTQHISWCEQFGIDGLLLSWWGPNSTSDRHIRKGLLKAPNLPQTKFAIFYEPTGQIDHLDGHSDKFFDFSEPKVVGQFTEDVAYLAKTYFEHPRYWKIEGRPVLGIYLARNFRNFSPKNLKGLRTTVGTDVFLIADDIFFDKQDSPDTAAHDKKLFDAHTAYNMLQNSRVRPDDTALTYHRREALPVFERWAQQTTVFPGFFPSYSDFRGNKKLGGSPTDLYHQLVEAAALFEDTRETSPQVILITSFNEWYEGTTIEPSEEYGTEYLQAIQRFKATYSDQSEPRASLK